MNAKLQAIQLIEQIAEMAKQQDDLLKILLREKHKAMRTVGEGKIPFHLRSLRELIESIPC